MAYNKEYLAKLAALEALATRVKGEIGKTDAKVDALGERVETLEGAGAQANVLETVKVNGTAQTITDKAVDIIVPTKTSDLNNDAKYQTDTDVAAAVAAADHLSRKKVSSKDDIDPDADDADQYIYMVPKSGSKNGDKYDEYMVIDGEIEAVGDWAVDLSDYVEKEDGKGLSSNDYSDEEKAKLAGLTIATDAEVAEMLDSIFGGADAE